MQVTAFVLLYANKEFRYFLGAPSAEKVQDWPLDGAQIGIVFYDQEHAPGLPYRAFLMGNDSYFLVPETGVLGHSDETVEEIRTRYGQETVVWRGMWVTAERFHAMIDTAHACDSLDKVSAEWLAPIMEALP
jgi:hypothetical protein